MATKIVGALLAIIALVGGLIYIRTHAKSPLGTWLNSISYACDGDKTISAVYYQHPVPPPQADQPPVPGGTVVLTLNDGRSLTLPQTLSADGLRYANSDESIIFWARGDGAFMTEGGKETYRNCNTAVANSGPMNITSGNTGKFAVNIPPGFTVDRDYMYKGLASQKAIGGIKFTVPKKSVEGTNLSSDTYISIEQLQNEMSCEAGLFLADHPVSISSTEQGKLYSVASTTGAGAGNRYEEIVYAISQSSPCTAIRYYIHSTAIENYPEGVARQFDRSALLRQFDVIRYSVALSK